MNKLVSFPYENILVLGLAKSGTVAAKLLLENGKSVRVNDFLAQEDDPAVVELKKLGSEVVVGSHPVTVLEDIQIIVKNPDRKSTRLNSSHVAISYAVFCLKKKIE